ncbi:phage portal protein [Bacillus sp. OTU530]|uniref:phage portal protein n=1 Tax=Bacillus sp. OTU530 TaxID=3043862 RepID=UPI00313DF7B5
MFKTIISKIKEVLYKLNIIKGIQKMTDAVTVQVSEESYKKIDVWRELYAGYHFPFHDIRYQTIDGQKKRRMASLGMPKVIAQEMATLVFNEKCQISISDEKLAENIKNVLSQNNFIKEFQRYIEYAFAMGGSVLKVYFDNEIKISYVNADCFLPTEWDNQGIRSGVFVNQTVKGEDTYTLLEWHTWQGTQYIIRNELYKSSNKNELGIRVLLTTLYPDLAEETPIDNLNRPLFVYIKPNTANNVDLTSPLGISLYANSLDTLKAIDTAFDSFEREFRLGKKRIIVPETAVKSVVDPETGQFVRYFDTNDEVYQAMNLGESLTKPIEEMTVTLRVEEHIAAINAMLAYLAMQTGFSPGAFKFDASGMKTATEVVSENSKTFRTKQAHETVIEAAIKELIEAIVQVAELYEMFSAPDEPYEVTVTFDDSIAEDTSAIANRQIMLVTAGLQSKLRAIMKVQGITEEEAQEILAEIQEENKTLTPEISDLFGTGDET